MWIGTYRSDITFIQVEQCPFTFQEYLTCLPSVKSITFHILEVVHQVGGFTVNKGGIRSSEWDMFCSGYGYKRRDPFKEDEERGRCW